MGYLAEQIQSPGTAMDFLTRIMKADSPYRSSLSSYAAAPRNARPRDGV